MPRSPTLEKTLHGKVVTQDDFKTAIVEALDKLPDSSGRAADVAPFLGAEWAEADARKVLNQTLLNMHSGGLLARVEGERGLYQVRQQARRGVSMTRKTEYAILKIIRAEGGFARWRDIMEGLDLRPQGKDLRKAREWQRRKETGNLSVGEILDAARGLKTMHVDDVRDTGQYRQITRLLAKSELIRQDLLVPGLYNIPMAEIHQMPLRGRWVGQMAKWTRHNRFPSEARSNDMTWMDERDVFFERVGASFKEVREGAGAEREDLIAGNRKLADALLQTGTARRVKSKLAEEWALETQAEVEAMVGRGAPVEDINEYRASRIDSKQARSLALTVLEYFEDGVEMATGERVGVNIHLNAPLSLYTTFADQFEVCPVLLSRGVIFTAPDETKLRPTSGRSTPDVDRLVQIATYKEGGRF